MPLLTEREHMQLWCPEARVVALMPIGKKTTSLIATPQKQKPGEDLEVEQSNTMNRLDMGPIGLKVPQACLCFGSKCGAWQWANWVRNPQGMHYSSRETAKALDPNMNVEQLGYCGKAAPFDIVPPNKRNALQEAANENTTGETDVKH